MTRQFTNCRQADRDLCPAVGCIGRPGDGLGAWLLPVLMLLVLSACAVPEKSEMQADDSRLAAERVARILVGRYAGRDNDDTLVRLQARVQSREAGGVVMQMLQQSGDQAARSFLLGFRPTSMPNRLVGRFAPLAADGGELGSCPIEVLIREDGFVARTDAQSCRFGSDDQASALVKEIAHDGRRLVIGDRVLDPASGEPLMADRVLEFQRVRTFQGWVGVRDAPDSSWRLAERVQLDSDGSTLVPDDAAAMTLGVALDLAPYQPRADAAAVLRLRAFDADSGALLGQAWADSAATRIGLALPDLQIGLALREVE
ncbi:MAG: hypothetical protein RQ741_04140 [Wenzhouxiangellaceae bacterium]|nr:hypothetical protein [Wenzhouxiangellaceae bacterium]